MIGMFFVCVRSLLHPENFPDLIMSFSIGFFVFSLFFNTIIQIKTYDKNFKEILEENKDLIFSISSVNFVIGFNISRAFCYGGGIVYSCKWFKKRQASNVMNNYFSSLPEFKNRTKKINIFAVWLLGISLMIFLICLIIVSIYNHKI